MNEMMFGVPPLCLSAMGGAVLIVSIFALMGKADILMDFEYNHFRKNFVKTLARVESAFGIVMSLILFFCASAILFGNTEKIFLALAMLGVLVVVYVVSYITFWVLKSKRRK